ncbi:TonB-dependent receptor [Caulobacter segnis]
MALGAQVRDEGLTTTGIAGSSGLVPTAGFSRRADRRVSGVFAEVRAPIFGDDYRRAGFERLEVSAAIRREHYTGGLSSTVPKIGVLWSPARAINLKATYGESFRAPSLSQQTDIERSTPTNLSNGSATVLTLLRYGGNAGLKPETAKSWTATVEFAPPSIPGARVTATLFDTKFKTGSVNRRPKT